MSLTDADLHIAAYVILNHKHRPWFVSPSGFIRWERALKAPAYETARKLLEALGQRVPVVENPGSGQPAHMLGRLQRVRETLGGTP